MRVELEVGERHHLSAEVRDAGGELLDRTVVFFSRSRQSLSVDATGEVRALRPGDHVVVALVPKNVEDEPRRLSAERRDEPNPGLLCLRVLGVG